MKLFNTAEAGTNASMTMLIYGSGGIGKTTFATTAPNPIIADCEGGTKYLGIRGINAEVAYIERWEDTKAFYDHVVAHPEYQTIVIDPLSELMEKLKVTLVSGGRSKFVQGDGSLSIAGWGELKDRARSFIKQLRDLRRNLILITHMSEKVDEEKIVKRPMILTKLSEEVINMMEAVGYMCMVRDADGNPQRQILFQKDGDRYEAKDRTGFFPPKCEPNFMILQDIISKKIAERQKDRPAAKPPVVIKPEPEKVEAPAEVTFDDAEPTEADKLFNTIIETIKAEKTKSKRKEMVEKEIAENESLTDEQRGALKKLI